MTTFYIVRHGETDYNKTGRYQGQMDTLLNDEGRAQAAMAAARMATLPTDVIYSSDLARAQETARIIARGREVRLDPRLREIHVGQMMGCRHSDVPTEFPEYWAASQLAPDTTPCPGGESAVELQVRIMGALSEIQARHPEERVLVVTHGGVIKVIAAAILEAPLSIRPKIVLENCSLTIVEWTEKGRRLKSLNDTGHLTTAPSAVRADF